MRGPNVPTNKSSSLPGAHIDLASTFLDIACVDQSEWPVYLDGKSLLGDWHNPTAASNDSSPRNILNVEFWGESGVEAPGVHGSINNSYKTLRVLGESQSWLYSKWCTGDSELYDTKVRTPYITDLKIANTDHIQI